MGTGVTVSDGANDLRYHGGNINAARRLFPNAPEPWIDLSTCINPVPYPVGAVAPHVWTRLPEPLDQAALEAAARIAYGAAPSTEIVGAPGTQALIQWLPRIFPAKRVGILGFTYGEHENCWRASGACVTTVGALADLAGFDVAVVVNPNNPDGRLVSPGLLVAIARSLSERGGLLVVDEAFMDVLDQRNSLVPCLADTGCIVLRSFGKIYGLAGLRLGFAAASPDVGGLLRNAIGPWAVSGPAIQIGQRALMDVPWLTGTISSLSNAARRLDALLQSAGLRIVGGTPLFRLTEHKAAGVWFERLARDGILARPFSMKPNWLRFGMPHALAEWERLRSTLHS